MIFLDFDRRKFISCGYNFINYITVLVLSIEFNVANRNNDILFIFVILDFISSFEKLMVNLFIVSRGVPTPT